MSLLEPPAAVGTSQAVSTLARLGLTALLDLVFPPFCPLCRARLGEGRRDPLCRTCWDGLERVTGPGCRVCGLPFAGPEQAMADRTCGPCRLDAPAFAYARAAARYGPTVRLAVHALKFGGRRALAGPLGDLMAEVDLLGLPLGAPEVIVPVPLHRARQRERGFNQAELLAARLGRAWRMPVERSALVRRRATAVQTDLAAPARRANVRGAFAVRRPDRLADRHVLLVDDVLTTGATAGACAAALRSAGARAVGVLTVARVA